MYWPSCWPQCVTCWSSHLEFKPASCLVTQLEQSVLTKTCWSCSLTTPQVPHTPWCLLLGPPPTRTFHQPVTQSWNNTILLIKVMQCILYNFIYEITWMLFCGANSPEHHKGRWHDITYTHTHTHTFLHLVLKWTWCTAQWAEHSQDLCLCLISSCLYTQRGYKAPVAGQKPINGKLINR